MSEYLALETTITHQGSIMKTNGTAFLDPTAWWEGQRGGAWEGTRLSLGEAMQAPKHKHGGLHLKYL